MAEARSFLYGSNVTKGSFSTFSPFFYPHRFPGVACFLFLFFLSLSLSLSLSRAFHPREMTARRSKAYEPVLRFLRIRVSLKLNARRCFSVARGLREDLPKDPRRRIKLGEKESQTESLVRALKH